VYLHFGKYDSRCSEGELYKYRAPCLIFALIHMYFNRREVTVAFCRPPCRVFYGKGNLDLSDVYGEEDRHVGQGHGGVNIEYPC
jgi:hypothetical protein